MSQKQPFTYTLPEAFLQDQSVPARWRVWAVINGFFITGQKCWASNEWLAEKIGAHKDTVSQAVKELENLNIIRCERGARSRNIYPMIGDNAYQWSASAPTSDRHQRLSISISNSVNDNSVAKATPPSFQLVKVREDKEGNELAPKKPRRSADPACPVYMKALSLVNKEAGFDVATNAWDFKAVKKAIEVLKDEKHVLWLVEEVLGNQGHQKHSYSLSKILGAGNLNSYKADL